MSWQMAEFIGALTLIREDFSSAPRDFQVLIFKTQILNFIINVQNICDMTGREEQSIVRTVLSTSILYSLTKKKKIFKILKKFKKYYNNIETS